MLCRSISERRGALLRRSCVARVSFRDRSGVAPMSLLCSSRVVSAPETAISFVAGSFDSGTRGNGWEASRPARCVPAPPCTRSNIVPMSFRCHSGVVSYQEARPIFCDGTTQERKFLSLQTRFILEREGTTQGPRSRERQERSRNDPQSSGEEDRTAEKDGRTMEGLRPVRSSFLSFGPRSSFEGRSESFQKERMYRNDARTGSELGRRVGKSGSVSPKF